MRELRNDVFGGIGASQSRFVEPNPRLRRGRQLVAGPPKLSILMLQPRLR